MGKMDLRKQRLCLNEHLLDNSEENAESQEEKLME